jgi:hypothetical protein
VINGEPCYEDMVLDYKPGNGYFTAYDVRVSAYWSVLAGAFGHTYGHHSIWQWHRPGAPGQMQPRVSWEDALDHPGAYHMMHLRHLMESRPLLGRRAAPDLIAAPSTEPDAHIQATLGAQDRYALVYTPQSQAITVNLDRVQSQSIDAWWFDPRTGQPTFIGQFASTGPRVFTPPAHGPDWVLVLDDSAQGFSPPGTIPTT